jgi:glycine hydroxymethyltransferase
MSYEHLTKFDPEIAGIMRAELERQRSGLEMIASENFVSLAVLEAMGSVLTNKYSEGYPGKRYYGGNEVIDQSESLAIARAKQIFGAEHANVQPHAGAPANLATYMALLNIGDTILAMNLAHGGHLTHGSPANFSGKNYQIIPYGVREDNHRIDMEAVRALALEHKPKIIVCGASAYPRLIDFAAFRQIADEVGAYLMADMAHIAGLVAAKLHPDPVPVCDVVTTTTHKTLRGPRGAMILCKTEDRLKPDDKKNLARKIDSAVFPGIQGGPLEHIIAAKAVAFKEALDPSFATYQQQILDNASALADSLTAEGLSLVSGGTDNHLLMVDVSSVGQGGLAIQQVMEEVNISVNMNMIPFDKRRPTDPSGIRLGTPALTTRGFTPADMKRIGKVMADLIKEPTNESYKSAAKTAVSELTQAHPLYPELS